ncbi:MAG TPA: alpha/beta fold hydrolase [Gemmatimonadales bacterium]|nr:alpha/beta fold hydrolase [Gemmatimonadales bacterium]
MADPAADARTLTRHVRDVDLFERRTGEGPAVVVLHGGPGAHHDYLLPGFDALATAGGGRTLVYYDQRGGGRSAVARDVPVGWREQVADLEALREAWGLERLTLAGYSWGALLAMLYAIEHPERVERLALVSPAPAWREARRRFEAEFARRNLDPALQAERQALRESGLREADPEAYQRRLFELSVVPYFHDPANVHGLTAFRVTGRTQQEVWESLGDYDLRPALRRLGARALPAVVLHGESDPIPLDSATAVAECLGADFHPLARCGHVPHVEAFERFAAVTRAFLA